MINSGIPTTQVINITVVVGIHFTTVIFIMCEFKRIRHFIIIFFKYIIYIFKGTFPQMGY